MILFIRISAVARDIWFAFKERCFEKEFWLGLAVILASMIFALIVNILLFIQYHKYYTAESFILQKHKEELKNNSPGIDA